MNYFLFLHITHTLKKTANLPISRYKLEEKPEQEQANANADLWKQILQCRILNFHFCNLDKIAFLQLTSLLE